MFYNLLTPANYLFCAKTRNLYLKYKKEISEIQGQEDIKVNLQSLFKIMIFLSLIFFLVFPNIQGYPHRMRL